MKAVKMAIEVDGTCNFCKRGRIVKGTTGLVYPYTHILKITGNTTSFNMCEDCMHDLQNNLEITEIYT